MILIRAGGIPIACRIFPKYRSLRFGHSTSMAQSDYAMLHCVRPEKTGFVKNGIRLRRCSRYLLMVAEHLQAAVFLQAGHASSAFPGATSLSKPLAFGFCAKMIRLRRGYCQCCHCSTRGNMQTAVKPATRFASSCQMESEGMFYSCNQGFPPLLLDAAFVRAILESLCTRSRQG